MAAESRYGKRPLSIGGIDFNRLRPFHDGGVQLAGYRLEPPRLSSQEILEAAVVRAQYSIAEVALDFFVSRLDAGHRDYVGLPVPTVRAFIQNGFYVCEGSDIVRPEDLLGKRIGLPDMCASSFVWQKGLLQDEYGIDLKNIRWVVGRVDEDDNRWSEPSSRVRDMFDVEMADPGETLSDLLMSRRIDLLLSANRPRAFKARRGIARLFPAPLEQEMEYFRRTGIQPIHNILILRQREISRDPDLPANLLGAFTAAKNIAIEQMRASPQSVAMVPFLSYSLEKSEELFGEDFWPYGLKHSQVSFRTFLRYCREQGVTSRSLTLHDMFFVASGQDEEIHAEAAP